MTTATVPRPYLDALAARLRMRLTLLLLLGLFSVAAVQTVRIEHETRPAYLRADDGTIIIADGTGNGITTGCRDERRSAVIGTAWLPITPWIERC